MPTIYAISREEAAPHSRRSGPGKRRQRMDEFDAYIRMAEDEWQADPAQVIVIGDIEENPLKFVLTLRAALRRNKVNAEVRKVRGQPAVQLWQHIEDAPAPAKPRRPRKARVAEPELVPA